MALDEASGRVLAEDLAATLTQPPFDASAMDGYAVRAADLADPASDAQADRAVARRRRLRRAASDRARRCASSPARRCPKAPTPSSSRRMPSEAAARSRSRSRRPAGISARAGRISAGRGAARGRHEARAARADACRRHEPCRASGAPQAQGRDPRHRRRGGAAGLRSLRRIRSSRRCPTALPRWSSADGGEAMSLGIAKDDAESLVTLARAGSAADILVTIGGASVGERDLVASALKAEGLELDFWKIAMRPGKPLLYGRLGDQRVLGAAGQSGLGAASARACLPRADAASGCLGLPTTRARARGACSARRCEANGRARALHAARSRSGARTARASCAPCPRRTPRSWRRSPAPTA